MNAQSYPARDESGALLGMIRFSVRTEHGELPRAVRDSWGSTWVLTRGGHYGADVFYERVACLDAELEPIP